MRVKNCQGDATKLEKFSEWLMSIGEGKHPRQTFGDAFPHRIRLPDEMCLEISDDEPFCDDSLAETIQFVFPDLQKRLTSDQAGAQSGEDFGAWVADRAILAPHNASVDAINDSIMENCPGDFGASHGPTHTNHDSGARDRLPAKRPRLSPSRAVADTFCSADKLTSTEGSVIGVEVEFLNGENCSGMPTHKLQLKHNCPIMLMRNLNPPEGKSRRAADQRSRPRRVYYNPSDNRPRRAERNNPSCASGTRTVKQACATARASCTEGSRSTGCTFAAQSSAGTSSIEGGRC